MQCKPCGCILDCMEYIYSVGSTSIFQCYMRPNHFSLQMEKLYSFHRFTSVYCMFDWFWCLPYNNSQLKHFFLLQKILNFYLKDGIKKTFSFVPDPQCADIDLTFYSMTLSEFIKYKNIRDMMVIFHFQLTLYFSKNVPFQLYVISIRSASVMVLTFHIFIKAEEFFC